MASCTINPPPTKQQQCTSLKPSTIEGLQQKRAPPPIQIGIFVLPAGMESACGIMTNMLHQKPLLKLVLKAEPIQYQKLMMNMHFLVKKMTLEVVLG